MPPLRDTSGRFVSSGLRGGRAGGGGGRAGGGRTWVLGWKVRTRSDVNKIIRKLEKSTAAILYRSAALVRTIAKRSIRTTKSREGSQAGRPPRTRGRKVLPRAILFAVNREEESAIIGPSVELAGKVGGAHEHGGMFRGERYDARPFMGPALDKVLPEFREAWRHSIAR